MAWLLLIIAIVFEIIGTTLLKLSNGFTKLVPTLGTGVAYIICFTAFSFALKKIPVSVAYAIWGAGGITIITVIGLVMFHEEMNISKIISITLIVIGVIGLNLSGTQH